MTERNVKIIAAVAAAAAVTWALVHYFSGRKAETSERPPGSPSIGPETTLAWPSGPGDKLAAIRRASDILSRIQSTHSQGSVP